MKTITRAELKKKYGIDLPPGEYSIEKDGSAYNIYSIKDDTLGCLLPGENKVKGKVLNSTKWYYKLMDEVFMPAYRNGTTVVIEIV